MLEILSETKEPARVQPHLKKCFEGVDRLRRAVGAAAGASKGACRLVNCFPLGAVIIKVARYGATSSVPRPHPPTHPRFEPGGDISGMVSVEGEVVPLVARIRPAAANGAVEKWLSQV